MLTVALLTGLLLGCSTWGKPDVVFITIDTLRVDHVGAFAADSPARTPHMDALAADGIAYTQAFSPMSVTGPAFVTLLTGQEPGTHGVLLNVFRGGAKVQEQTVTLAEVLDDQGYATGAFVSGYTLRRKLGLAPGFEVYSQVPRPDTRRAGNKTSARALEWFDAQYPWEKVFLWYHSYDPHGPLTPYAEAAMVSDDLERDRKALQQIPHYQRIDGISDPAFYQARYAAAVEFADKQVGRIVAALKEDGRYDDALIVLAAEHGESFTERELWFDHGTTATAEQLQVPLVVKLPGGEQAGTRVDRLVGLADIVPSVVEVAGLPAMSDLDGRSLLSGEHAQLTGESSHCKKERVLRCRPVGPAGKEFAVRTAERTVRRRAAGEGVEWEVYDRIADPWERTPLDTGVRPDSRALLDAMAEDRLSRGLLLPSQREAEEADPELDALRALGYVDE